MPKSLKTQDQIGIASIVFILILVSLLVIAGAILFTQGIIKLPGKSTSPTSKSANDVQVGLETKYDNPFDKSTQYQNPFSEYQNPFDQLK